ncbi:hypothetical protein MTR67_049176 [Solanum verrucosum]|uniref:Uncharacterized protein n=1 Tax=Solanum verrucosum TaxID=315347 RepID=A0AAF0V2S6_SOLVR|nr:hypothetical protein MTR67_049176 [Solanum verrucosum]
MDNPLNKQGEILERLTTGGRKLNEAEVGIRGTLELILERLNAIARRSTPVPNLNSDETERSVCKVNCKCNICIGIDATSLRSIICCVCNIDFECTICIKTDLTSPGSAGGCLHSIDCECDIHNGSDTSPTSLGDEGLNCDETEIIWPHDFHILDDPQVKLDSLIFECTRELDLSSLMGVQFGKLLKEEVQSWLETCRLLE